MGRKLYIKKKQRIKPSECLKKKKRYCVLCLLLFNFLEIKYWLHVFVCGIFPVIPMSHRNLEVSQTELRLGQLVLALHALVCPERHHRMLLYEHFCTVKNVCLLVVFVISKKKKAAQSSCSFSWEAQEQPMQIHQRRHTVVGTFRIIGKNILPSFLKKIWI